MRAVMDQILAHLTPAEATVNKRAKVLRNAQPALSDAADRHWLPALQRWLPGAWANIPISDRAVKSDEAIIDLTPWRLRIQFVLPWCSDNFLELFELRESGAPALVLY